MNSSVQQQQQQQFQQQLQAQASLQLHGLQNTHGGLGTDLAGGMSQGSKDFLQQSLQSNLLNQQPQDNLNSVGLSFLQQAQPHQTQTSNTRLSWSSQGQSPQLSSQLSSSNLLSPTSSSPSPLWPR